MRKLILLSSVFALSLGVFAPKDANAQFAVFDPIKNAWDIAQERLRTIWNEQLAEIERMRDETLAQQQIDEDRKASEQAAAIQGIGISQGAKNATAIISAGATTAMQAMDAGSMATYANAGGQNCVIASGGKGMSKVSEGAEDEAERIMAERMSVIKAEPGTDAANGKNDFYRQMALRADTFSDDKHINFFKFLNPSAHDNDPSSQEKFAHFQKLVFARNPISLNPDVKENPDTSTLILMTKADQLKAEMSVGQAIYAKLQANRKKVDSTVAESLADRLRSGGWSEREINELTENGVSRNSMYKALTKGSYSSEMLLQKASANERDLMANLLGELALNNVLQFEQYQLLEAIAAASGISIATSRDSALKDLDAKISAKNARQ